MNAPKRRSENNTPLSGGAQKYVIGCYRCSSTSIAEAGNYGACGRNRTPAQTPFSAGELCHYDRLALRPSSRGKQHRGDDAIASPKLDHAVFARDRRYSCGTLNQRDRQEYVGEMSPSQRLIRTVRLPMKEPA